MLREYITDEPGRLGRCRENGEEAIYWLLRKPVGSLRTAKAKSIYTRHYPISLDYRKDQSHTFFARTRLRFIHGKKNHTHIKGKRIDLERHNGIMRKLREFEIPNTLLELAGAEQRNFHSLTSGLIFFQCSLFFFCFFSFPFFSLFLLSFLVLFPIVFILSVHLYRLQGHTLFSPLP